MASIFTPKNSQKYLTYLLVKHQKLQQKAELHLTQLQNFYKTELMALQRQIDETRIRYNQKIQNKLIKQKTKSKTDDSSSPERDSPGVDLKQIQEKLRCQEELLASPTMKSIQTIDLESLQKQMANFNNFLNGLQCVKQQDEDAESQLTVTDYDQLEHIEEQKIRDEIDKINNNFTQ